MDKNPKTKTITVFSTPTCPFCHMAKSYLKDHNIPFKDVDVSIDQQMAKQMVMKSGEMGVPQLWIDDKIVIGFDKDAIDNLLEI